MIHCVDIACPRVRVAGDSQAFEGGVMGVRNVQSSRSPLLVSLRGDPIAEAVVDQLRDPRKHPDRLVAHLRG
jgi:hypothetical protein